MVKYQIGIQKTVLKAIRVGKNSGLPYLPKQDITNYTLLIMPDLDNASIKVGQALFQLQRSTKYRRPRIRKFYDKKGKQVGWSTVSEETAYSLEPLPNKFEKMKKAVTGMKV